MRHLPGFGPVVAQECSDCGKKYNMGGPIWSAPIHDMEWVNTILADVKSMKERYPAFNKIISVLTTISEVCLLSANFSVSSYVRNRNPCFEILRHQILP